MISGIGDDRRSNQLSRLPLPRERFLGGRNVFYRMLSINNSVDRCGFPRVAIFFRSGDLTSGVCLAAGAGICGDGSGTLGESLWITGNREIGSSLVQAKPCQGSLRVETARSPRVSTTSEPGGKPVLIDAFSDIRTPMSGAGGRPVVL